MITPIQYFAGKPHTPAYLSAATDMLGRVNALLAYLGCAYVLCPNTGTQISGSKGGSGDGGFRLTTATTGAAKSSHKEARAVDVYDPTNAIDAAVTDDVLIKFGLYRETPTATPNWCHLTTRAPASGHRTFMI